MFLLFLRGAISRNDICWYLSWYLNITRTTYHTNISWEHIHMRYYYVFLMYTFYEISLRSIIYINVLLLILKIVVQCKIKHIRTRSTPLLFLEGSILLIFFCPVSCLPIVAIVSCIIHLGLPHQFSIIFI